MSEYFQRVANDVLKASEELSAVMEDGIAAMLNGGAATTNNAESQPKEEFEIFDEEDIEEELMDSPLQGMTESVLYDLMKNQAQPETLQEKLEAFRSAITWSEPFIMGLLAFHLVVFVLCIMVSRPTVGLAPRLCIMVCIAILVRSAEMVNSIAGQHWQDFATQNYFDRQGVFFAIMISGPLLFDCLIMLIMYIREAAQLLVTVKTNELRRKKENQKKKAKGETKKEQ